MLSNPYVLGAALIGFLLAIGGAGYKGYRLGQDNVTAKQAREDQVRFETLQMAQQAAAEEIAKIEVRNVTQKQILQREIVRVPDYSRCVNSPAGLSAINAALTGAEEKPAGDSELPATDPVER